MSGIDQIDRQHQNLIDLVDTFCSLPIDQYQQSSVRDFLGTLLRETEEHFRCEEKVMADRCYPRLGVHKVAHARLLVQIADVHRRAELGENLNFGAFMNFLQEWLITHIDEEDSLITAHHDENCQSPARSSVDTR